MLPGKKISVTHVTEHIVTHVTCFDTVFYTKNISWDQLMYVNLIIYH